MTTDTVMGTSEASGQGIRVIRRLMAVNLGLVALQAVSAGFSLQGYAQAATVHAGVGLALQVGALIQIVTALVLWWRGRAPGWLAGLSLALFAVMFVQLGLGYRRLFWLHVPIGVGIFGGLLRQMVTTRAAESARE
jgi:hypothetical protein